ncbi:MAG TPA: hypothetical protein VLD17_07535 [Gemmatimonadaceae bacterium]|jgi:hypothetical protein|nr:hypothetical protein [Gemmatimonadaceae bacterium]
MTESNTRRITGRDRCEWVVEEIRPSFALLRCTRDDDGVGNGVETLIEAPFEWAEMPEAALAELLEVQQLAPFVVEKLVGSVKQTDREKASRITVGELREMLNGYSAHTEITFGCTLDAVPLAFSRIKSRSLDDNLVQIELAELTDAAN